jgi:hypothetical protein
VDIRKPGIPKIGQYTTHFMTQENINNKVPLPILTSKSILQNATPTKRSDADESLDFEAIKQRPQKLKQVLGPSPYDIWAKPNSGEIVMNSAKARGLDTSSGTVNSKGYNTVNINNISMTHSQVNVS